MATTELQHLSARHKAIMSLALRGYTRRQIANAVGMSDQSVSFIVNSQVFQTEMARRQQDIERLDNDDIALNAGLAKEMINRETLPSVMKIAELRDGSSDQNLQLRASESILKMAYGTAGANPAATVQNVIMINSDRVQNLFQIAKEAGLEAELGSNNASPVGGTPGESDGTGSLAEAG